MLFIIEAIAMIFVATFLVGFGLMLLPYIGALVAIVLIFMLDGWFKLIGVGILALCIWFIGKNHDWWD